jgi:hypothetical protein
MQIIRHRVNTCEELRRVPKSMGVELDIRTWNNELIIHHDPFCRGESLSEYLDNYDHQTLILNAKCEGMENEIMRLLKERSISNYFFLDLSLPFLIKFAKIGMSKIAVRYSEYEPIEFVLKFKNLVDWVWVDCFDNLTLTESTYDQLKNYFKICLVSPELHCHEKSMISTFKKQLENINIDAVCTKYPELWE